MRHDAFGIGYSGREPVEIHRLALQLNAVVVDIRLSPRSRKPEWNKGRLTTMLGNRYLHLPELGNVNYKGGDILLKDPDVGIAVLLRELQSRSIILMCVCGEFSKCHRRVVADLLKTQGVRFTEIGRAPLTVTEDGRLARQLQFPDL